MQSLTGVKLLKLCIKRTKKRDYFVQCITRQLCSINFNYKLLLRLTTIVRDMFKWCFLLSLVFSTLVFSQPANDLCSRATQISTFPYSYTGTTVGASKEHTCNAPEFSGDVWFTFTPTTLLGLKIGTCTSEPAGSFDTIIYVTSGSCDSYICLQFDDEGCRFNGQSYLEGTNYQAGVTYFIIVSGWNGQKGTFTLTVDAFNSNCVNAQTIPAIPFSVSSSLSASSFRAFPCGSIDRYGDWYAFTSPASIGVRATTCIGSSFSTSSCRASVRMN